MDGSPYRRFVSAKLDWQGKGSENSFASKHLARSESLGLNVVAFRLTYSSSGPGVFTWTVRVKGELFTAKFFGAAKLFTAGCGELAGLSSPSVNNFGGTIRLSEP